MNIESLIGLLKMKEDFLKSTHFGYIEILSGKLGEGLSFKEAVLLEKFANSKPEGTEQIVLKTFDGRRTLFISFQDFDLIIVYDGQSYFLSQFWRRDNRKVEAYPINYEKYKDELLKYFSTSKKQKLAS